MNEPSIADLIQHLCQRISELQKSNQGWSIEMHGKGTIISLKETVTQQFQASPQRDEARPARNI